MEEYFSIKEFASYLKFHPNTIRRSIKRGKIQALKVGRDYRIPKSEINRIAMFDLEQIVDRIIEKKKIGDK